MDPPQKVEDYIFTLPKENGWLSDDSHPLYYFHSFWYHETWLRGAIASQAQSQLSPSDIILACNPKCGATWLKALSFSIITRTRFTQDENPLQFTAPHDLIPFMELNALSNLKTVDLELPLVSTHLPYTNLPSSILALECKIVYIWRDPKDAFVSSWHFTRKLLPNKDVTELIPLEEAFDLFCHGISPFGPYWEHVLGYWKSFLAHPDKILFLKYEDMIGGIEEHVTRLARFMGHPFSVEEEKEGAVARIVEMCSFESLSNLSVNKGGVQHLQGSAYSTKDAYFRKASVGDWKNYLTKKMANKIDQITIDKLGAYGLSF